VLKAAMHLEGGFFTGDPAGYVKKGSGDGHLLMRLPHCGTWKGVYLLGYYM